MPVRVLAGHGVLGNEKGVVSLNVRQLSLEQKAHLRIECSVSSAFRSTSRSGDWRSGITGCSIPHPFPIISGIRSWRRRTVDVLFVERLRKSTRLMLTTLSRDPEAAKQYWKTCNYCAPSATARKVTRTTPTSEISELRSALTAVRFACRPMIRESSCRTAPFLQLLTNVQSQWPRPNRFVSTRC